MLIYSSGHGLKATKGILFVNSLGLRCQLPAQTSLLNITAWVLSLTVSQVLALEQHEDVCHEIWRT